MPIFAVVYTASKGRSGDWKLTGEGPWEVANGFPVRDGTVIEVVGTYDGAGNFSSMPVERYISRPGELTYERES